MANSSSTSSSSDSLTEKELQLLMKLTEKYEKQKSGLKKIVVESSLVKATPYIPTVEKPKRVKHTIGRNRIHGRIPPMHPSSKRSENLVETSLAHNLKSSKRLRTDSKPF
ncbi:hypothetical protein JCGZ_20006 [Jatropha curcas]|uniref:Uncharacterized protein n=1 Tax=Jatropha curcas TaxID=180498 RepID=A0A067JXX8_JATCU|nr:hypothetical protein JCGZ_20005 [Jatropha curcas]KDP27658.1 hypothetical protein JCGZ_20006 [Jatropha curcas]